MARAGEHIENPVTGERVIFRATTAETGGALLGMDYFAPPHHVIAPPHVHPRQEERTEVLAGTLSGRVGGRKRTLQAGESVTVPAGTMHGFRNAAAVELHTVVEFRPALRTEIVFETFVALARAGKTNARGMPSLLHTAVLTHEYLDEVGLPLLPLGLQRALLGPLAAIGRRRGYQPSAGSAR